MEERGEPDSLQPNLEGADRARSSEVCVCVSARSVFVHMYVSCVDVSVLRSFAVEVNRTSRSLLHACLQLHAT